MFLDTKEIKAEGIDIGYIFGGQNQLSDPVVDYEYSYAHGSMNFERLARLNIPSGSSTRLAFFKLGPEYPPYISILTWLEAIDLEKLDERVRTGKHSDTDFRYAFRSFLEHTVCSNCGATTDTLCMESKDTYSGAHELYKNKLQLAIELKTPSNCPKCNELLRRAVIKFVNS